MRDALAVTALDLFVRVVVGVVGAAVVAMTVLSAIRTVVVPRAQQVRLTAWTFKSLRALFLRSLGREPDYLRADRRLSLHAPIALTLLPLSWLSLVMIGFAGIYFATGVAGGFGPAVELSGSSLTTLGFAQPKNTATAVVSFVEAGLGLFLLALMITYLPSMYQSFSRRELAVASLEIGAGSPPDAVTLLSRYHRLHGLDELDELWPIWQTWFADIEETHTSLLPLAFFRSPQPNRSWISAAGCILDAASLRASVVDLPREPHAELCVRSGYVALRRIADVFDIDYDPDPHPDDATSISRREFDSVCRDMAAAEIPLKGDFDAAWRAFNGWRVNYDAALLGLAALTVSSPQAHWSGDRADVFDSDTDLDRGHPASN